MIAIRFDRFGPPDVLGLRTAAEPHAGPGQVRIRARAAGVSPVDLTLRAGGSPSSAHLVLPHIPGVDAAGVVDEIGAGVEDLAVGDDVFGTVDIATLGGACAEFAVLAFWARKPESLSWTEAGAAGTSVETATRALDLLDTGEGTTLLIDGASGGVGSVAVQLAIARGASVIGTARPESHAFLAGLGARPVAYGPGLADRIGAPHVDQALDVAGAGSLDALVTLTGSAESVITLADFTGPRPGVRLSRGQFGGEPDGRHGLALAAARGPRQGKIVLDLTVLGSAG
ncbi:MAG TPA: NADP-dependent oxidoreductase [Pseudonocardiaceae bacterium]|jgi:NADPH:quinone reductase-like Zn-dependent oxidoreductase